MHIKHSHRFIALGVLVLVAFSLLVFSGEHVFASIIIVFFSIGLGVFLLNIPVAVDPRIEKDRHEFFVNQGFERDDTHKLGQFLENAGFGDVSQIEYLYWQPKTSEFYACVRYTYRMNRRQHTESKAIYGICKSGTRPRCSFGKKVAFAGLVNKLIGERIYVETSDRFFKRFDVCGQDGAQSYFTEARRAALLEKQLVNEQVYVDSQGIAIQDSFAAQTAAQSEKQVNRLRSILRILE
ncbi:MAG: hypothetical protein ACMXYF_05910 [Candidatus Woesearchaeota archaeon]